MPGKNGAFDRVVGETMEPEFECFSCRSTKPPSLTFMSRVAPPIFGVMTVLAPLVGFYFAEDFVDPLILGMIFFVLCGRSIKNREKGCSECGSVFIPGARREGFPGTGDRPVGQGRRFAADLTQF